ncbi:serine/threonine-protein kinase [Lignipirellula cremea]|uniref:Serine/threonine-protein kinase PknB n=1 Tax=Lignipirellula cremea TaxID=2528010 RepID=A0A518DQB6_9BACT|nr:serine/threonine-protein kinase [Lignipirellula cremea]QDU94028.1 Serine/threonine-protein kinase PknB [Lignipirellula cremea]
MPNPHPPPDDFRAEDPDQPLEDDAENLLSESEVVRRLDRLWRDDPSPPASPLPNLDGKQIGRYSIERVIGYGGFGVVYKARDHQLHRDVALKIPRPEVLLDRDKRYRFELEAQTAARLDHPAIVPVYEADVDGTPPYLASAYCPGLNLAEWLGWEAVRVAPQEAVALMETLADAIHYAHTQGVIHRDLKPSNIMLSPLDNRHPAPAAPLEHSSADGPKPLALSQYRPRLTDFGLARLTQAGLADTRSSMILGTPLYMSPEQAECQPDDVGPTTDIFALGAILYHLLTGVPPFAADSYPAVLARLGADTPDPIYLYRPDVDKDLQTICMKCLQKSPKDRYQSAVDLADDLRRYQSGDAIVARPANAIQRLQRWSVHRARVSSACAAIIVISCVKISIAFIGLLMISVLGEVPPESSEFSEVLAAHLLVTTPLDLFLIWAAQRQSRRRLPAALYWVAFAITYGFCLMTFCAACRLVPSPAWFQRMPGARTLVFTAISLLFAAQTIAWYLADWPRIDTQGNDRRRRWTKQAMLALPAIMLACIIATLAALPGAMRPAGPEESSLLEQIDPPANPQDDSRGAAVDPRLVGPS